MASNLDPSNYSNLREYVEAVQGAPIDYSRPGQYEIVNAAVNAMYGGQGTAGLSALIASTPTPAPTGGGMLTDPTRAGSLAGGVYSPAPAAPTVEPVPSSVANNSIFQDVNSHSWGTLESMYVGLNSGKATMTVDEGGNKILNLGDGKQVRAIETSTPGVYAAVTPTSVAGTYTIPFVFNEATGKGAMPDNFITTPQAITYQGGSPGGFFRNLGNDIGSAVGELGKTVDDLVNEIPGGWATVALATGAYNSGLFGGAGSAGAGAAGASGVSAESLAIANATTDPIAALNALEGWTTADLGYLAQIGLPATYIEQAAANNAVLAGQSPNYYDGNYTATAADTASFLTPEQLAQYGASAATIAALTGGAGGAAGAGAAGAAGSALTGSALAKLAGGLLTTKALTGGMGGGGNVTMPTPSNRAGVSTGSADYSPEYYQQLQQYYNAYMPTQPKDVATPLQQWYETKFTPDANVTNKLFGV